MTKKRLVVMLVSSLLPRMAFSYGAGGTVAAPYLDLPMGVRGTGMGEAFSGVANDVNAIYYNPAGLTALETSQLELMHLDSFGGIQYENLGLAVPTDQLGLDWWGTVGLSYTLVGIDDTPRTQVLPGTTATFDQNYANMGYVYTAGDSVVTLSYAWQATKLYSIGASLKAINEKVDTASGWGLAGDIGILSRPPLLNGMSAGLTLQNLGSSPEAGFSLPSNLRLGIGDIWDAPFTGAQREDQLTADLDLILPIVPVDDEWQANLGAEYKRWFGQQYAALRLGYRYVPEDQAGTESGLSVGGSLGTHLTGMDLTVDYAWVPYGLLGSMQRFSLTGDFGAKPHLGGDNGAGGFYLFPPNNVQVKAGDASARISWDPQKGRVDGYNLYLSYDPAGGKWVRLNNAPIAASQISINSLYNGYKIYFAVSTLAHKRDNVYQESEKSQPVMALPMGTAAAPSAPAPVAPVAPTAR